MRRRYARRRTRRQSRKNQTLSGPSGRQRRAHDPGRVLGVPLRLGERLVDLLERIRVRDQAIERPARAVAHEEVERARDHPRVVHDDTDDALGSPHQRRRLQLDLGAAADRADLEIGAALPEHVEALGNHLREADEVAGDVGAGAAGPVADELHAILAFRHLFEVDRVVGAELPCQLESPGDLIDDDHDGGAHVLRDGRGLDAEAAGTLDHDRVAEAQANLVQAEDHLAERAVHRRHEPIGQLGRDLEQRAARLQIVVLGERAVKMRELRRAERASDLEQARRGLLVEARRAPAAGIEVRVRDAVALGERPAQRVGLHVAAELRHAAGHLVTEDPTVLGQLERRVAPPEVQIRSAHVGERDTDQDRVGLDVGDGQLAQLERLAGTKEDGGLALHTAASRSRPSAKVSWSARTASSAYLSSMTHDTAISDVEIIWMLIPSRASAANIWEATPEWLRIPTPTMETLATRSSWTIPRAPISRATSDSSATARA